MDPPRALLLNGTVGVGKSTVAAGVGALLTDLGVPNAVLDMDELRRTWPAPEDDPFNFRLAMDNLSALSMNFVRVGARRLVLAGVMETRSDRAAYESAVGMPLVSCRLKAETDLLSERLSERHSDAAELRWHLHRSPELDRILEAADLDDCSLDVSGSTVPDAAGDVLRRIGWVE